MRLSFTRTSKPQLFPTSGAITALKQLMQWERLQLPIRGAWRLATILGVTATFALYPLIMRTNIIGRYITDLSPLKLLYIVGIVCFVPLGLLQWFILRRRIQGAGWWLVSTVLGWSLFVACWNAIPPLKALNFPFGEPLALTVFSVPVNIIFNINSFTGACIGFAFGVVQWLVLIGRVHGAYKWIFISTIAFAIGLPIASGIASFSQTIGRNPILETLFYQAELVNNVLPGLVAGAIVGIITQLGIDWLFQNPVDASETVSQRTVVIAEDTISLKKFAHTLALALVFLIMIDFLFGAVVQRQFPETPAILHTRSSPIGLKAFWEMSHARRKPVVFVGSSAVFSGIAPYIFDAAVLDATGVGVVSVNMGIQGGTSTLARDMIRDVILPQKPSVIVYLAERRAFYNNPSITEFEQSPLGYTTQMPPGVAKTLGLWLLEHSTLVQYRNNFHDLLLGRRQIELPTIDLGFVDDRGHYPRNESRAPEIPVAPQNDYSPLEVHDINRNALIEIVQLCQQSETHCIVVHLPVFHSLASTFIPEQTDIFHAMLRDSTSGTKVDFWDFNTDACRGALGLDAFADPNHLGLKGATRFTQMLAAVFVDHDLGVPLAPDAPARCALIYNN